ncbi:MAG: glycosyltransferase 87 family protein, partial [Acidimicrobiales bacterium]
FLLLAIVLAQRRRPGWSGLVFGVAVAMKFTAWPLAVLALLCARDRDGRRAPGRMLLGMCAVAGPVVSPFVLSDGRAFFDDAVLYPLGFGVVGSPAASNLPGHLLVLHFHFLHTAFPLAVALVGGALLVHHLWRRPPASVSEAVTLAGWVMLVAIMAAPTTRVGYLLYPLDFFAAGWLLSAADSVAAHMPTLARGAPTHV